MAEVQEILCPTCHKPSLRRARFCQHCGYDLVLNNDGPRYYITRVIKAGGQGAVFEAIGDDGRIYAVKEMLDNFTDEKERTEAIARFEAEAKILERLSHPRIPKVYADFKDEGRHYFTMDFVQGENLDDVLQRQGAIPEKHVLEWADQICDVLDYLHRNGLIYCDMKPSTIMLDHKNSGIKLVDFKNARVFKPIKRGIQIGSPGYASPEQYQGIATPESDIYMLGATLHHMLSGRDPHNEPPFSFPPIYALRPTVSKQTSETIQRALQMKPEDRYRSMAEFRAALRSLPAQPPQVWVAPTELKVVPQPAPPQQSRTSLSLSQRWRSFLDRFSGLWSQPAHPAQVPDSPEPALPAPAPFDKAADQPGGGRYFVRHLFESVSYNRSAGQLSAVLAEDDGRVINAWIEGVPSNTSLRLDQSYVLAFDVGSPRGDAQASIGFLLQSLLSFQQTIAIQVEIETSDFTIADDSPQTLVISQNGISTDHTRFTITPRHKGSGSITARFIVNSWVFQRMLITVRVDEQATGGTPFTTQSRGHTLSSTFTKHHMNRHQIGIGLSIVKRDTGYDINLRSNITKRASVNFTHVQVAELVSNAQDKLKSIVYTLSDGRYIYQQEETFIPNDIHQKALRKLAEVGYYLYQQLFYGTSADARVIGDQLRDLSQQNQIRFTIDSEQFVFPWHLMYDQSPYEQDHIDYRGFWGFKHIIEYTPEVAFFVEGHFWPQIRIDNVLDLAFVYNNTIDHQLSRPVIETQRRFLKNLSRVRFNECSDSSSLYSMLRGHDKQPHVLYFYCHAESNLPGEKGGVDQSKIILSRDDTILLRELEMKVPPSSLPPEEGPLVFMNACQSAKLSPHLYDGFVPFFITRGARGVIGTETDIPAFFAAEFAQKLLQRFLVGEQPLGEILLDLRCEYVEHKNNLLGLLYTMYGCADKIVQWPNAS